jgi:hypothetical protein
MLFLEELRSWSKTDQKKVPESSQPEHKRAAKGCFGQMDDEKETNRKEYN